MSVEHRSWFLGDSLAVLRSMDAGSVDLVATDPPLLTDDRADPAEDQPAATDQLAGCPAAGEVVSFAARSEPRLVGGLRFLAPRLVEMRRVLSADGSTRARLTAPSRPLEAREPGRAPPNGPGLTRARLTAHGGPKATSWTGSRAHGPGPRSTRARAHGGPGSPSKPSKLDRLTFGLMATSWTGPKHEGRAHLRADATGWTGPTFEGRGQSRARLTVGLTVQGRAHRPSPRNWTGSLARAHRRAHRPGPGSRAHGFGPRKTIRVVMRRPVWPVFGVEAVPGLGGGDN